MAKQTIYLTSDQEFCKHSDTKRNLSPLRISLVYAYLTGPQCMIPLNNHTSYLLVWAKFYGSRTARHLLLLPSLSKVR